MLSMARALLTNPRLLLLDEPTEGLAPLVIAEIETVLARLKEDGLTILLVEQNLAFALAFADQVALLGKGQIRWTGSPRDFVAADAVKHAWLGL
jgi:branched-chain amino acid transport system ATP-binding protein